MTVDTTHPIIVKMVSGDWLQFSSESKARSFIVDLEAAKFFNSPTELAHLGLDDLKREYLKLVKIPYQGGASTTQLAIEMWTILLSRAKNPLQAFEGKSKGDGKLLGKRASLIYKCQYTFKDADPLHAAFTSLPQQAKVCLRIVFELEQQRDYVDSRTLELELNKRASDLKTKQDPWRVLKFYQARMIEQDLLRLRQR